MVERWFDAEKLYNDVVHFYIDKKGQSQEEANRIARIVVRRESKRRKCHHCGHMNYDHIRNVGTCLYRNCQCSKFVTQPGLQTPKVGR